jgi:hypothetical protein
VKGEQNALVQGSSVLYEACRTIEKDAFTAKAKIHLGLDYEAMSYTSGAIP